jgi:hypothetical protein
LNAVTARVLECADQEAGVTTDIGEHLTVAGLGAAMGLKHAHRITKGKAEAIIDTGTQSGRVSRPWAGAARAKQMTNMYNRRCKAASCAYASPTATEVDGSPAI